MERQIKLIWDFRGPAAEKTAQHHEIHLKEFIEKEQKLVLATGVEHYNEVYSIAFLAITESDMIFYRDALKPHRATLYEPNLT